MKAAAFDVPVAIFAFNRPNLTRRIFDAVAERRPQRLFLVADGPRADCPEDNAPCDEVRKILMEVSWPCEVATNFSDRNLGCGRRMSSGIDWLFEHVDAAILIEDDCLPAPPFFDFCSAMLSRFANDQRIGLVSGSNFTWRHVQPSASYYFSRYTHIWGWATWRRSWAHYDFGLRSLSKVLESAGLEIARCYHLEIELGNIGGGDEGLECTPRLRHRNWGQFSEERTDVQGLGISGFQPRVQAFCGSPDAGRRERERDGARAAGSAEGPLRLA